MARIDKIKEEIGWLKVIFAISIATNISLIAWLIQSYQRRRVCIPRLKSGDTDSSS